jgi:hypothetical protein
MNIQRTSSHQVYITKFDEIPLPNILPPAGMQSIQVLFGFGPPSMTPDAQGSPVAGFQFGIMRAGTREIPITKLVIENRRILLDIEDESIYADKVFTTLIEALKKISGRVDNDYLTTLIKAEESEVVAHLDFPAEKLLTPQLAGFVDKTLQPMTMSNIASSAIQLASINFMVSYKFLNSSLDSYKVTLIPKEFNISPRPGVPLSEQVYYSKAPVDTETHKVILRALEDAFR